jgi:hypothetical protein
MLKAIGISFKQLECNSLGMKCANAKRPDLRGFVFRHALKGGVEAGECTAAHGDAPV